MHFNHQVSFLGGFNAKPVIQVLGEAARGPTGGGEEEVGGAVAATTVIAVGAAVVVVVAVGRAVVAHTGRGVY